jgi:hypothetical protein
METIHNIDNTVNTTISIVNCSLDTTPELLTNKDMVIPFRKGVYLTPQAMRRLVRKVSMHVDKATVSPPEKDELLLLLVEAETNV